MTENPSTEKEITLRKTTRILGILARFVDAHGKCDAQIGVRGSNKEQL